MFISIADVSSVLDDFSQEVTLKTIEKTGSTNFQPIETKILKSIYAVVQPADIEKLEVGNIDFSLRYIQIHTKEPVKTGQFIVYNEITFKIINVSDFADYGYYMAVCEEVQ